VDGWGARLVTVDGWRAATMGDGGWMVRGDDG